MAKQTTKIETQAPVNEPTSNDVQVAGGRYISERVDNRLGHVCVMAGMAIGGYMAFTHAHILQDQFDIEVNVFVLAAAVAAGVALGNIAGQLVYIVGEEIFRPFVPNHWYN